MNVLDTNILLEVLENRARVQQVIAALERHKAQPTAVTTLSLSNIFYFAERDKYDLALVEKQLKQYLFLDVTAEDAAWAFAHYQGKDFEDALQVAAAIRQKANVFMTLDAALAAKYQKFLKIELIR
jgi:predicted nucleic acid-binding protein